MLFCVTRETKKISAVSNINVVINETYLGWHLEKIRDQTRVEQSMSYSMQ